MLLEHFWDSAGLGRVNDALEWRYRCQDEGDVVIGVAGGLIAC